MTDIINPGIDKRLEANIYPVTKVFCDDGGFVSYERDGTAPIVVDAASPSASRKAADKRRKALMRGAEREAKRTDSQVIFMLPISNTGRGLTYNQFDEQTDKAIAQSFATEEKVRKTIIKRFRTGI